MTQFIDLRDAPYREVLDMQHDIFNRRVALRRDGMPAGDDYLITVTHQPVYTLGRHADPRNVLRREWLASRGAEVVEIDRGGDVTFHGPGQLVVYPIIDLQSRGMGIKTYVNLLEEAVIRTVGEYGIEAGRIDGATGVWIGCGTPAERKICAIGLRCSRFITMHGLALNISTDLTWFSAINPCGFTDKGVTTLYRELAATSSKTATPPTLDDVSATLRHHLTQLLKL